MKIVLKQFKDIVDDSREVFFLLERHFLKVENNILLFFNYALDLVQGLGKSKNHFMLICYTILRAHTQIKQNT